MTVWYSDHFGTDGIADNSLASPIKIVSAGVNRSRVRYKRATVTGLALNSVPDVIPFFKMKSGARIINQWISSDGAAAAGAMDIGLYLWTAHDIGAAVDVDLFSSAQAISTAIHKTAALIESDVLQHEDAGKTLWEMAAVGAGSDTVDPLVEYAICGTVTTSFTTTAPILTLEALYTDGT